MRQSGCELGGVCQGSGNKHWIPKAFGLSSESKSPRAAPRLIKRPLRTTIITVINKVVDIPIIGEVEEQVIFTKIVDAACDAIEEGIFEAVIGDSADDIMDELASLDQDSLDAWRDKMIQEVNGKIDIPILNEEQEEPIIRFIIDKFLDASLKGGYAYGGKKFFGLF